MKHTQIAIAVLAAAFGGQPLVGAAQDKPSPTPPVGMQAASAMQQQMMERMKAMQKQMETVRQTTDPKEREKLLAEHMKSMQEGMQAMRGTGGGMMDKMGGGPSGSGPQGAQTMESRMDMMQMMMEQMMQHEQMQRSPVK